MTITFAAAKKLFDEKKYQQALQAYEELGKLYGPNVVEYNILICRELIDTTYTSDLAQKKKQEINTEEIHFLEQDLMLYRGKDTALLRKKFTEIYESSGRRDIQSLIILAELDIIDKRFEAALHKVLVAINLDKEYIEPYKIGEYAAKELKNEKQVQEFRTSYPKSLGKRIRLSSEILEVAKDTKCQSARETQPYNTEAQKLVELAILDLQNKNYQEALTKAQKAISLDKNYRKAYYVGEQAAVELGNFEIVNKMYLCQPAVVNPIEPRQRGKNPALSKQFILPSILGVGNDYEFILERASLVNKYYKTVSIIMPVYNRKQLLANTLAALTHQTYPHHLIEIIVVDDGSSDDVSQVIRKYEQKLNLYYVRQKDDGYRLAAARNLGIKFATGDAIVFMDADILPLPNDIEKYMRILHVEHKAVLIGHRRYVDVSGISDDMILSSIDCVSSLPDIIPDNDVVKTQDEKGRVFDWRFDEYKKSDFLRKDLWPFTKAAGGNLAFSRTLLEKAGPVDEDFQAWGGEDGEHGYRMYNAGAFFVPMLDIICLHQEPLQKSENNQKEESFRKQGAKLTKLLFADKCPAPTVRRYTEKDKKFSIPKVSIYIPAYNAGPYILQAINSCLNQDFDDLEVCVCNDGSTDNTEELLKTYYSDNPKVRWVTQKNKGIGSATNVAIGMCRGMYIAQLDSDDILKPTAVRACMSKLDNDFLIDAVYTDCDYIDKDGNYIRDGWCGGVFDRNWMMTATIATPFRMFRKRLWNRINGCNENIKNAVDLDLWLKFNERANVAHIHSIQYSYRWHGKNTSVKHRKAQENNHLLVIEDSLKRQKLHKFWKITPTENPLNPREFLIQPREEGELPEVTSQDVMFLIPSCLKNKHKMDAIRKIWCSRLASYGFRYLFLVGNPDIEYAQVHDDILYVPCRDDYESLLLKLMLGLQFVHRHIDFDYIYKIDDDCIPRLTILQDKILPQLRGHFFAGGAIHYKGQAMNNKWHFGKCSCSKFDKPYKYEVSPFDFAKGGYGYFLRRDVIPFLTAHIKTFTQELESYVYSYEDVRISEILEKQGITPYSLENYSVVRYGNSWGKDDYLLFDITNFESLMKEI